MSLETDRAGHWREVYRTKPADRVSWYQTYPRISLELIAETGLSKEAGIIDVGGGASTLVDHLLQAGFCDVCVLDIAETSLDAAKSRLGERADRVEWMAADVTNWEPHRQWSLWHDRAVFQFLVDNADRKAYVATLKRAIPPAGHVIVATFAPEGPERCSGLPVMRHSVASMRRALGNRFAFVASRRETHVTPSGSEQRFLWQHYVRRF